MGWGPGTQTRRGIWYVRSAQRPSICMASRRLRTVRTAAYTSEITTLNRGQYRTYRLSFRRYQPGYGGQDQTAFLFIHGHLGSYRQSFNIAEWCTTNRSVWYAIDFAPASLAACRACEIQSQADYVATVLQALEQHHRQVVVVAHSMGGIVSDLALVRLGGNLDSISSIHLNVPWSANHPIFTHPALAMAVHERLRKASTGRRISFSSGVRDNVVPTMFTEPGTLELSRVRNVYESFTHVNLLFSRPVLSMFKEELLPFILEGQTADLRAAGKIHDHLSGGLGQRTRPRQLHNISHDDTGESIAVKVDRIRRIEPGTTILHSEGVRGYWEINAVSVMPKTPLPANEVESGSAGDDFNTAGLTRLVLSVSIKSPQGDWIPVPCDYIAQPRRISLCMTNRQAYEEESASSIGSVVIRVETDSPVLVLLTGRPRRRAELGVLGGKLDLNAEVICSVTKGPPPLMANEIRGLAIVPAGHARGSAPSSTNDDYLIVRTPEHEFYSAPLRLTFSVDLERLVVNTVREGTGSAIANFLVALRSNRDCLGLALTMLVVGIATCHSSNGAWEAIPALILIGASAAAGLSLSCVLPRTYRPLPTRVLIFLVLFTPVAPSLSILLCGLCHLYAGSPAWAVASVLVSHQSILCFAVHMWYTGEVPSVIGWDAQSVLDILMGLLSILLLRHDSEIARGSSFALRVSCILPFIVVVSTSYITSLWWGILVTGVMEVLCRTLAIRSRPSHDRREPTAAD
ncbi:hypothetical protein FOZ62_004978 [Perkinsus olseni]|uniref:GPI inositol-deacylase n=2 Tax=Perkinsus olseni TaxID=32597 RepID=A0A7J6T401_PEROL|nr:hypothetical protein FOZ62_004978 [Perkinsus olseni]